MRNLALTRIPALFPARAFEKWSLARILTAFLTAFTVAQERRRLAGLDRHQLDDLGLTAEDVAREAARPIWDLPQGR